MESPMNRRAFFPALLAAPLIKGERKRPVPEDVVEFELIVRHPDGSAWTSSPFYVPRVLLNDESFNSAQHVGLHGMRRIAAAMVKDT